MRSLGFQLVAWYAGLLTAVFVLLGTLRQLLMMRVIGLPIGVCVAVIGGFVLVRRALKPVERIAHKAAEISQHNLSGRLPVVQTGDELERLSISLNYMLSHLEASILSSKQFVAGASHKLLTPLAVLRGELEGLAQNDELKLQTREALGSMLEEVDRLAEIVEGLLALSRLDAGAARCEWVSFDLAELAATTTDQMSLLAEDKNVTVDCDTSSGVNIEGDRSRMKQVIVNLLDNAIEYTLSGGRVRLKIASEGGHAVLGLSIVKSICAAHRAEVEVASVPGAGSRFRITQSLADITSMQALS